MLHSRRIISDMAGRLPRPLARSIIAIIAFNDDWLPALAQSFYFAHASYAMYVDSLATALTFTSKTQYHYYRHDY